MITLAPIILFVYNRPEHTKMTIESLIKNSLASDSKLFIFSDGPKNENDAKKVREVRKYLKTIQGFGETIVNEREENLGLANSVIYGVNEVINKYGRTIVMEDDIVTAPMFLTFMNRALDFYKNHKNIFSISGYTFPIKLPEYYAKSLFLYNRSSSWGWSTWKDRWEKSDWEIKDFKLFSKDPNEQLKFNRAGEDLTQMLFRQMRGEIDSWAIRWAYAHFKNNAFCLYPSVSLCRNIGMDRSGTHSTASRKYEVLVSDTNTDIKMEENPELDENIAEAIRIFMRPSIIRRIINSLKFIFRTL